MEQFGGVGPLHMRKPVSVRQGDAALKNGNGVLSKVAVGHAGGGKNFMQALQNIPVQNMIGKGGLAWSAQTVRTVQGQQGAVRQAAFHGKGGDVARQTAAANGQVNSRVPRLVQGLQIAGADLLMIVKQGAIHIHGNQTNVFCVHQRFSYIKNWAEW